MSSSAFSAPDDWKPPRAKRRELLAGKAAGIVRMSERVGRREEEAVRTVVDETLEMFFRYRQSG